MANMLQLKNVTVSYKNVPTVQNFNLDMKQGQIVSLVGESGKRKDYRDPCRSWTSGRRWSGFRGKHYV